MTQKTKLPDYSPLFKPRWSGDVGGYTKEQLQAYGAACAAHAMQSQAERIKELEAEIITRTSYGDEQTDFAIKLAAERDALRAELDAIAATEPVAKLKPCKEGWFIDLDNPPPITGETIELFTRPMSAQDVNTELVEALQLFVDALPLERSTVKTCYAVTDQMRDSVHAALSKYKGAK